MTKKKTPPEFVDAGKLSICDDPLPNHRALPGGKYDNLLKKIKVGQCIKCPTDDVAKVCGAMRKLVSTHNIKGSVRSMTDYGDGFGRVWLVAQPAKALKAA